MHDVIQNQQWLLSLGTFLPLAGVLVMLFCAEQIVNGWQNGFEGPEDLGRLMFLFEFAVAIAGYCLELNPFDQPNVQEAKDRTRERRRL